MLLAAKGLFRIHCGRTADGLVELPGSAPGSSKPLTHGPLAPDATSARALVRTNYLRTKNPQVSEQEG